MHRVVAGFLIFTGVACAATAADPPAYRPQSATPVPVIRTTPQGCTGFQYMVATARIGREGVGKPAFTHETTTLSAHYLGAQTCRGWAALTPGEHLVSCTNDAADQDAVTKLLARHAAAIKACFPAWKADVHEYWAGFTSPDGKVGVALSIAHPTLGPKLDTLVRYQGAAPSGGASAAAQSERCLKTTSIVTMARTGREDSGMPAFTSTSTPLSKGYAGAPRCTSWTSEGGGLVNCPINGDSAAWAERFFKERTAAMAACVSQWRRQDLARLTAFTSLDGSVSLRISMPDPAYGPMVETTAHHRPCEPLREMAGRARVGRIHVSESVPTTQPTPLEMRYFGAEACSVHKNGVTGGHSVACVFPEGTARSFVDDLIKTVAACEPKWKRTNLSQGASFDQGDGLSFVLDARDGRPPSIMTTFDPKAK